MQGYTELKNQLDDLKLKVEFARKSEATAVISQIRSKVAEYGLEPRDIFPFVGSAMKRSKASPKYMNPETGATWSGRGRAPRWIADAQDPERFLLDKS
ncbi:H-NS histone family protein (plasmid) [Burkholderia ambifaria]